MKVTSGNKNKPYHASPRRNGYDHNKGTFANSDRERCGTDDDKGPQWEPQSEYENRSSAGPHRRFRSRQLSNRSTGSDSDNRSNQSARSKGSDRSHVRERYGQDSPTQVRRDRGGSAVKQQRSQRLRNITRKIAALPTQNIKPSDYRFKDMTHPRLPIRSLEENCSHVNQYRRWVNDKPTRSTEVADKMLDWIDHFEVYSKNSTQHHRFCQCYLMILSIFKFGRRNVMSNNYNYLFR